MSSQQDERARGSQEAEETNQGALSDEELEGASGGAGDSFLRAGDREDDEDSATRKTDSTS